MLLQYPFILHSFSHNTRKRVTKNSLVFNQFSCTDAKIKHITDCWPEITVTVFLARSGNTIFFQLNVNMFTLTDGKCCVV